MNELYEEAIRKLRELQDGAEPYHSHVYQYAHDPSFRAFIALALQEKRKKAEDLKNELDCVDCIEAITRKNK